MQLATTEEGNKTVWGGQIQAISRLLLGIDPYLSTALPKLGLDESQMQSLDLEYQKTQTPLVSDSMPIQDVIDLADFLVDMTKRYGAFLPGADTVGGDTDIATVTRYEGFKWIRRKHYYPHHLNRRTSDHAADSG